MHLVTGICVLKEVTYLALNNLFLMVQISKLAMHTDETGRRDFLLPYKSLNPENQISSPLPDHLVSCSSQLCLFLPLFTLQRLHRDFSSTSRQVCFVLCLKIVIYIAHISKWITVLKVIFSKHLLLKIILG